MNAPLLKLNWVKLSPITYVLVVEDRVQKWLHRWLQSELPGSGRCFLNSQSLSPLLILPFFSLFFLHFICLSIHLFQVLFTWRSKRDLTSPVAQRWKPVTKQKKIIIFRTIDPNFFLIITKFPRNKPGPGPNKQLTGKNVAAKWFFFHTYFRLFFHLPSIGSK